MRSFKLAPLLVVVVVATLGGCAAPGVVEAERTSASEISSMVSPTPTPIAIAGDSDGDGTLSEFEKQLLAQRAPRDYVLSDGTTISVDPTAPLDPVIVTDVVNGARPLVDAMTASNGGEMAAQDAAMFAMMGYIDDIETRTGRGIVITHISNGQWGSLASAPGGTPADHITGMSGKVDKAEMLSAIEAWATPRNRQIIVVD
jgi:hypothetical protein